MPEEEWSSSGNFSPELKATSKAELAIISKDNGTIYPSMSQWVTFCVLSPSLALPYSHSLGLSASLPSQSLHVKQWGSIPLSSHTSLRSNCQTLRLSS